MKFIKIKVSLFFLFFSQIANAQSYKLETVIQKGHNAAVKSIAVSADGKYAVTGSRDKSAKLWDLSTGRELRSFLGHEFTVNSVQFSQDGKYIASSSIDKTAKIWEVISGKEIFSTEPDSKRMTDVAFTPDGKYFICGGYTDSASVYDIQERRLVKKLPVNADQGLGLGINFSFSPDGKWLAVGEDNRTAIVYHTSNWKEVYKFTPKEGWCGGCGTMVNFSADSRYLLKLSGKDRLEKYDLNEGTLSKIYEIGFDDVTACSFSPDGKMVMASGKNQIKLFDTEEGSLKDSFSQSTEISEVVYSVDGASLLIAQDDNLAAIIDVNNGQRKMTLSGFLNETDKGGINYDPENYRESYIAKYLRFKNKIQITPDGKHFIKGKSGTKARKWDIISGEPVLEYSGHDKAVICFDFSADGKYFVTGDANGKAFLWDVQTGKYLKTFDGHREPLFEAKFNPDGLTMSTASWDGNVIIWDIITGKKIQNIDMDIVKNYSVYTLSYTPDGLYLVMGNLNKNLELWEPDSKSIVRNFIGHTDIVSGISFSPDKKLMLSSSWDGTARLWDISTGMMVKKFTGNKGAMQSAIFTSDGKNIITAGDDRIIRIYEVSNAKLIRKLEGHQSEISSLVIGNNGKNLISASLDGVVKLWDLEKGKEFYEHIHVGAQDWMVKSPEGYFNGTPGATQVIHFVKGMESFGVEQFYEKFYRPDLLPKLFKDGADRGQIEGVNDMLKDSPPPRCKMAGIPNEAGTRVVLHYKVTDEGGGIDEIKLLHNGKRIKHGATILKGAVKKGEGILFIDTLQMVGGLNTFSISAYSKQRIESTPVQIQFFSESKAKDATCHVFVIGIDKYRNSMLTLNYARSDAETLGKMIKTRSGDIFKKVIVHSLFDEKATRQNILDTLSLLANKIYQNDVFIFFYAGHGSMSEEKFYFIPTDCLRLYDQSELNKKGLEASLLQEKFKNIKALKQIIIMDACQSGGSVEMLATRGGLEEKAIAQLSRSAGIHVLASAGSQQSAQELKDLEHGLFTYVLIQALSGEADGAPSDGKVTVYELKSYLDDQVPVLNQKYSGKPQYPYTFSRGHDFPIVLK